MKILHFISGIRGGGVEQLLINYTNLLNSRFNYDEIIVYQHHPDQVCIQKLEEAGNKCIRIADKRKNPLKNLMDTYKIIKHEKPDIVHCHMSLLNIFPLIIAKFCNVKIRISHSHTSVGGPNFGILTPIIKKAIVFFSTNLLACGYDAGKYLYGNNKFKIVRNAINVDAFLNNDVEILDLKGKLNIPINGIVIGNIGRFVKQKNHERLIKLFYTFHSKHVNSYLLLIGSGELEAKIKKQVSELHLEKYVRFLGSISDVSDYYKVMDLFLLPSLYEGLPVVSIEAQATGIPTILSSNIDKDSVILETTKSLNLNLSDDIWVENMEELLCTTRENKENIKEILIRKGYSINSSFKKLNNYYLELLRVK